MQGVRILLIIGLLGTIAYNFLQLTVPFFSQQIIDKFLTGDDALDYLHLHKDEFYRLIIMMVGFTLIRVVIAYFDGMAYEYVSQKAILRNQNYVYDNKTKE